MNSITRRYTRKNKYKNIIISHIRNNIKEYAISCIIFFIGLLIGIVLVNNLNDTQITEVTSYITTSIDTIKESGFINNSSILHESLKNNILIVIFLWFIGSTVIGLLLVYLIVCFKGFCFGYTVSIIIYVLGKGKGLILLISTMLLKNIIVIPSIIALSVSGMKLYKSIMQDRRKENIKIEIIRHTLFSIFILILLIVSSFVEVYSTQAILQYCIKYF